MTLEFDATDSDLTLFLEEAAEQLRTLSDGLLRMERDASDGQLLQAVFRAAHTLKGSSATIGHQRMAGLTHAMESILDDIRKGALPITSLVIDTLLACVDALNVLNEEVMTREESDIAIDALVARVHEVAGSGDTVPARPAAPTPAPSVATSVPAAAAAAPVDGPRVVEIDVAVNPGSEWPAVRAYQALMELAALGEVIASEPSEARLQTGEAGHTLHVTLRSAHDADAIRQAVLTVTDIVSAGIREPQAAAAPPPKPVRDKNRGPQAGGAAAERRRIDLGADMRGASMEEQLAQAGQRLSSASRVVKVDIARLDDLMYLVGELVIDRGRLMQVLRDLSGHIGNDAALDHLSEITQHLSRVSDDLQEQVMLSRLLPVESVFNRFPRMVRDLARKSDKSIRFVMEGEQTGLDRSVIDEIGDPLLHLLRNAVDHGVEPAPERIAAGKPAEATLLLSARHEESYIIIEVTDDGRGVDPTKVRDSAIRKGVLTAEAAGRLSDEEAINLIFAPGFSTADQVTAVSGRGVGMDIVRTNIEKIGGTVKVRTAVGEGTTFSIKLPLTLAIIRALLVRVDGQIYTVPLTSVQETMRIATDAIHTVQRREVVLVRGQALPLVRLADVFARRGARGRRAGEGLAYVVVVRSGRTDLGLIVDKLIGEQEVVIKSMGGLLGDIEGVAGATILGDGRVSMIVDVPKVVEHLAAEAA
jgi:two-component system chemotaxis sensor kinase CheA